MELPDYIPPTVRNVTIFPGGLKYVKTVPVDTSQIRCYLAGVKRGGEMNTVRILDRIAPGVTTYSIREFSHSIIYFGLPTGEVYRLAIYDNGKFSEFAGLYKKY